MSKIRMPPSATRSVGESCAHSSVIELDLPVLVGAAVRAGLRNDADPALLAGIVTALRRHAVRGDPACELLAPWLERRIANRSDDR
ncbi:hypothetical protein [Aureimonas phyllosphaerae]|uniref:Uncharacterized protein n=1 Tax=Aureimonas phyllosphaerae TaxID=1166078 RepID=A0A7W6BSI0_9HYPH|nr:hypothetical protein [Aureimonas phyllosphaerae]MBB3937221.1 hypothetical protein [Aureimonas phyllosphaerae]MBB3961142.1 hypothetical protein [Aureimonas phyllosphaerae]SFF49118.1 hypothetical protein SAMN05216566_11749 [Aureimonas phyllosphaerae]